MTVTLELTQDQINLLNLAVTAKITEQNKALRDEDLSEISKDIKIEMREKYRDLLVLLPEMK